MKKIIKHCLKPLLKTYNGYQNHLGFIFLEKEFIHGHQIVPLSEIGKEFKIDPVKDLRSVCPNCHAMIHRGLEVKF